MELQQAASSSSSPPPSHSFTPDGQYRIDGSDLGLLGAGAHGTVRIAQHVETLTCARRPARHQPNAQARAAGPRRAPLRALRTDVAVKISPISVMRSACKEMTALTRLHSQNIVQLLGVQARARARARRSRARGRACRAPPVLTAPLPSSAGRHAGGEGVHRDGALPGALAASRIACCWPHNRPEVGRRQCARPAAAHWGPEER